MQRSAHFHLLDIPELRRAYSRWRHAICNNPEDRRRYERTFVRVFIERIVRLLGRRKECHFDEEITSGTRFQGTAKLENGVVHIWVLEIHLR